MKQIIFFSLFLNSFLIFSQTENIVINESFDNNFNNWEISSSDHWDATINKGNYNLSNTSSDKTSYFKRKNISINNKREYSIETNIKFDFLNNESAAGLIFINDEEISDNNYSLLLGYLLLITKFNDDYYLRLNKSDWSSLDWGKKINNFDSSKTHNLKVKINNDIPLMEILIDNVTIFKEEVPLFNFSNIGFYQMGKVSMVVDDIKVKTSNLENTRFLFDISNNIYNHSTKKFNTLKGYQYIAELTKYVPKAVLIDDYYYEFQLYKKELLIDENCTNFKTIPTKNEKQEHFSFLYKTNLFFSTVGENKYFNDITIKFSDPNKAVEFYNLYSRAKQLTIEGEIAFYPLNKNKGIMINKENNWVTIFY